MKKTYSISTWFAVAGFFLTMVFTANAVLAQHANIVVFSDEGHKFTLFVNGDKINAEPATRVRAEGLRSENNRIRVDFEDKSLESFSANQYLDLGYEYVFEIHQGRRGYRLRHVGGSDLPTVAAVAAAPAPAPQPAAAPAQTQQQTQEQSGTRSRNLLGVTITEGDGRVGVSIDSDLLGIGSSSTTTTTTTTTTSSASGQINAVFRDNAIHLETGQVFQLRHQREMFPYPHLEMKAPEGARAKIYYGDRLAYESDIPFLWRDARIDEYITLRVEQGNVFWQVRFMPQKSARTIIESGGGAQTASAPAPAPSSGCATPMNADAFGRALASISNQGFEENRLNQAKTVARSNCLSINQIAKIMREFGFEQSRLDFAKFAYDFTSEKGNYYLLNDEFSFSASATELNNYISSK